MDIFEATDRYEAWLAHHTPLARPELVLKHAATRRIAPDGSRIELAVPPRRNDVARLRHAMARATPRTFISAPASPAKIAGICIRCRAAGGCKPRCAWRRTCLQSIADDFKKLN